MFFIITSAQHKPFTIFVNINNITGYTSFIYTSAKIKCQIYLKMDIYKEINKLMIIKLKIKPFSIGKGKSFLANLQNILNDI